MAYRNIYISNNSSLRLKNNQLIVNNGEEFSFPIEDIRSILIDNDNTVLSSRLISRLAEDGVCLILCGNKHLPSACLLPISVYCRQNKRISLQFSQSKPVLKKLWQNIITAKIANQAKCLELNGCEFKDLLGISRNVTSGDSTNREGYAARIYFKRLFGDDFIREDGSVINAGLNYGYAILRSYIAKTLVLYGFEPSVGIHHKNQLNQFNLADDLIEPYRPIVDNFVKKHYPEWNNELLTSQKAQLLLLLNSAVIIENKRHSVANAIELTVQSIVSSFEEMSMSIKLPCLIDTEFFDYE